MTANPSDPQELVFKAFLSHRYKSPAVNLFFYDLLSSAEVQFEVDEGSFATNVTRLERAVRDADAFIGIYPFSSEGSDPPDRDALSAASRYFRLELDLALRAGKPSLVLFDGRFTQVLDLPPSVWQCDFAIDEAAGPGGSPRRQEYLTLIGRFYEQVASSITTSAKGPSSGAAGEVGILLPRGRGASGYTKAQYDAVETAVRDHGITKVHRLPWPPVLSLAYLTEIEKLDWLITDVGPVTAQTGIVGYVHGRAIPTLRLLKQAGDRRGSARSQLAPLYTGVEVGYAKDILAWSRLDQLRKGLARRLIGLNAPRRRISTRDQAVEYFEAAAKRKEAVFVSYSGLDVELAGPLLDALRRRFQTVFDYRDGDSITPGEPWLQEIFGSLAEASIGVPLVSANYLASGNCLHEAQEMVALRDADEIRMMPVKLVPDQIELPVWMRNRQYLQLYAHRDAGAVVDKILEFIDR